MLLKNIFPWYDLFLKYYYADNVNVNLKRIINATFSWNHL